MLIWFSSSDASEEGDAAADRHEPWPQAATEQVLQRRRFQRRNDAEGATATRLSELRQGFHRERPVRERRAPRQRPQGETRRPLNVVVAGPARGRARLSSCKSLIPRSPQHHAPSAAAAAISSRGPHGTRLRAHDGHPRVGMPPPPLRGVGDPHNVALVRPAGSTAPPSGTVGAAPPTSRSLRPTNAARGGSHRRCTAKTGPGRHRRTPSARVTRCRRPTRPPMHAAPPAASTADARRS